MEKKTKLKTKDGYTIYGTLNSAKKKSDKLIIFVHGLTGHQNEHIFYNAAQLFPQKGFDTFRFDLYNGEKGGRLMTNCTVLTHSSDVNRVIQHFRNKYRRIAVVGHSKGGPCIFYADTNKVDAIVLWDPSSMYSKADLMEGMERQPRYIKELKGYVFDWGVEMVMGEAMMEDYEKLDPLTESKKIAKPIKIICAEHGNAGAGKKYLKLLQEPKELVILKGAGHTFNEEGVETQLFDETLKWVKKYL